MVARNVRRLTSLAVALVLMTGCLNVVWRTQPVPLSPADRTERVVRSPIKVHMKDGSTVIFRGGALLRASDIAGEGERYALLSDAPTAAVTVPLDSVAAIEAFEGKVVAAPTIFLTAAATAAGAVGFAGLMVLIFGSCPTVYADSGGGLTLQAEGFSYAIAPMFEHRDVDRLSVRPDRDGVIRLELRNEALETHFINQVELAQVRHARGATIVPDQASRPLSIGGLRPLLVARDRAGRDARAALASHDGQLFASAPAIMNAARAGDLDDWIDLEADSLPAGDSIAVVLRLRNSMLNTILLYEGMLGGPDALDWLGTGLSHINAAIDLARWYGATMGMHASIVNAAGDTTTVRLNDVGPIAFRDVAIVLPRPRAGDTRVRVRLRFVADNWRIDQAQVAGIVARPTITWLPVARVVIPAPADGGPPAQEPRAVAMLAETDDRYLETRPGQRMTLEFDPPAVRDSMTTTYLLGWQGWYREWIRGDWITHPTRTSAFVPGDSAVLTALRSWQRKQADYERQFYSTRLPVR